MVERSELGYVEEGLEGTSGLDEEVGIVEVEFIQRRAISMLQ